MPTRSLTPGEIQLLQVVFGPNTLPYDTQQITTNDANIGGFDNSITYGDTPHYANNVWRVDFSEIDDMTWVFVHEFGHVWQNKYGAQGSIMGWLANVRRHPGTEYYALNYPYDLTMSARFSDYNTEQQASIVADYWALNNGLPTQQCNNPQSPQVSDYEVLMGQVKNPGSPPVHTI